MELSTSSDLNSKLGIKGMSGGNPTSKVRIHCCSNRLEPQLAIPSLSPWKPTIDTKNLISDNKALAHN